MLVFCDSFDHYLTADLLEKWDAKTGTPEIVVLVGRRSTQGLRCPAGSSPATLRKVMAPHHTWTVGAAVSLNSYPTPDPAGLIALLDGDDVQVDVAVDSTGHLVARRGDAEVLGTSGDTLATGTMTYLELQAVIGDVYQADLAADAETQTYSRASGSFAADGFLVGQLVYISGFDEPENNGTHLITAMAALTLTVAEVLVDEAYSGVPDGITFSVGMLRLRLDGAEVLEVTQVATQTTGNASVDGCELGMRESAGARIWTWDDVYCCDGSGSQNITFLGDVAVTCQWPADDGALQEWTGDFDLINDVTPDDDGTYLLSTLPGQRSTFVFGELELPGVGIGIKGIALTLAAVKDVDTSATIQGFVQSGETTGDATPQALTTAYHFYQFLHELDPNTGEPWALVATNAAEWGVELVEP